MRILLSGPSRVRERQRLGLERTKLCIMAEKKGGRAGRGEIRDYKYTEFVYQCVIEVLCTSLWYWMKRLSVCEDVLYVDVVCEWRMLDMMGAHFTDDLWCLMDRSGL